MSINETELNKLMGQLNLAIQSIYDESKSEVDESKSEVDESKSEVDESERTNLGNAKTDKARNTFDGKIAKRETVDNENKTKLKQLVANVNANASVFSANTQPLSKDQVGIDTFDISINEEGQHNTKKVNTRIVELEE